MESDLYARKSTLDQGRSVSRQERAWRSDCAVAEVELGRVFVDPDFSASRYARRDRPDYAALIEHIQSGQCQMVSLWEVTRGSRQMSEWVAFLDLCREKGVLIRVFGDGSDPQTFDPRRQRDREALLREGMDAEGEVERLRSRVLPGIADAAAQGRPPGPLLYGYAREYGAPSDQSVSLSGHRRREIRQVINESAATRVRQWAADTLGLEVPELNGLPAATPADNAPVPLQVQADALNDAGVPTPSGRGRWVGGHINRYLQNPGYLGQRMHKDQIVASDAWPAILDEETFARLKKLFETPGRRHTFDSSLVYQLSGAALCACCRRVLRVKRLGPERTLRYHCAWKGCMKVAASQAYMDAFVEKVIRERLRQDDVAAVFAPAVDDVAVQAARKELRELEARLDEHVRESAAGRLSARALGGVERELQPQIDAAERKLRRLLTPPTLRGIDPVKLADDWPNVPAVRRREAIMALAEVVLSPVGKGGRWSPSRLAESRWVGDPKTWGDHWRAA